MRYSKYNIIRFILDYAYVDHNECSDDWNTWFQSISRMFNYRIPDALLDGLSRQNDTLREICIAYKASCKSTTLQSEANKYQEWKRRRDEGNSKELERRKEEKERLSIALKAHQQQQMESQWESMQPTWDKKLDDIVKRRQEEVPFIQCDNKNASYYLLDAGSIAKQIHAKQIHAS